MADLDPNIGYKAGEILYNGETLTSIYEESTTILCCSGKKAVGDITVSFLSAGSIIYNGKKTTIEAGNVAIMKCKEKSY